MVGLRVLEFIRSLGFGALLGSGLAGLIYLGLLAKFPTEPNLENVLLVGALIGAGSHQLIDALIVRSVLHPLGNFVRYYGKLVQLVLLRRIIGHGETDELIKELTRRYFLEQDESDRPLLPP
jgi:membrane-bound metal-dependent hydrolase YbcI (DUF457 family)